MATILEFIQEEVKSQHSTISRFIDEHFNRTGFYRMMNEPNRISEDDIGKITRALELNTEKEQELRLIIRQSKSGYSEGVHREILRYIYRPSYLQPDKTEVEFLSSDDESNKTIRSYRDILGLLRLEKGARIEIKIRGCLSMPALGSLCTLLSGLRMEIGQLDVGVTVEHILTVGSVETVSKIELLLRIAHAIQFADYSVYFLGNMEEDLSKVNSLSVFDLLENTVTIQEKRGDQEENRQFIFHISNIGSSRDYCFSTKDRNLYDFFLAIFYRLKAEVPSKQSFYTVSAAKLNKEIAGYEAPYRRLLIKSGMALDNIHPRILSELMNDILHGAPQTAKKLRGRLDPEKNFVFLSDRVFYELQVKSLEKRFHQNEHAGSINIYDVRAFARSIKTGFMPELIDAPPIGKELIKIQLQYLIEQIGAHYADPEYQQFYFFKRPNATSNLHITIIDTKAVCIANEQSLDPMNSNFLYCDPETAKLMYTVIADSLPSDEVLTREESLTFLKSLLASVGRSEGA